MPKDYPNFESIISGFLSKLELATKSDVQSLMARIDHLEQIIASVANETNNQFSRKKNSSIPNQRISDHVLEILRTNKDPMTYSELKEVSGFDEKSLRNAIYRLNKLGRIETIRRGQYTIPINKQDPNSNDS